MELNKEFFKRASTYSNIVAIVASSLMAVTGYIPMPYALYTCLGLSLVNMGCQIITFKARTME